MLWRSSRIKRLINIRKIQHYNYVEVRVLELRERIIQRAIKEGDVDQFDRMLFLKYNNYLKKLRKQA